MKDNISIIFIGHVNAGKSTLASRLVLDYNPPQNNHQHFNNVMDETKEEIESGNTIETGLNYFETSVRKFTILDAPGHKSFVPNMILGVSQADVAILVVSARKGEFETGFEKGGQTREHCLIAKTMGVSKFIVVFTKIDDGSIECLEYRIKEIKHKLMIFLTKSGFKTVDTVCVSSVSGQNMDEFKNLLDSIVVKRKPNKDDNIVRIPILDKYTINSNVYILGKIESGSIKIGDKVLASPLKEEYIITEINLGKDDALIILSAKRGDNVKLCLKGKDIQHIRPGFVLCDVENPCRITTSFIAEIVVIKLPSIMSKGYSCIMHLHTLTEECEIVKIDRKQFLREGERGKVRIQTSRAICMEQFDVLASMGRFTLRSAGETVAVGKIIK